MNFNEQLIIFRKRAGLSIVALAGKIDVTPNYIGNVEKKYSKPPTLERCQQLATALNLSPGEKDAFINAAMEERLKDDQLQWIEKEKGKSKLIPVVDWVHANQFGEVNDPFPQGTSDEYITASAKGENMFALRVKNDCMEPRFKEGDVIIVDPEARAEAGHFVVIKDADSHEATFKQLKRKNGKLYLHPLNSKYPDIEFDDKKRYIVVGRVVEKREKV